MSRRLTTFFYVCCAVLALHLVAYLRGMELARQFHIAALATPLFLLDLPTLVLFGLLLARSYRRCGI